MQNVKSLNFRGNENLFYIALPIVCLGILKFIELGVFFLYVDEFRGLTLTLVAFLASVCFLTIKTSRELALVCITVSNLILIYIFEVSSQHFALLTSLIFLISFAYFAIKVGIAKVEKTLCFLVRLQVGCVYIYAALWKSNSDWLTGTEIVSSMYDWALVPSSADPFPPLYQILAVLVIFVEILIGISLIAKRFFKQYMALMGILFHFSLLVLVGEDLRTSFQILLFGLLCIYSYNLDTFYEDIRPVFVYWDASCSVCKTFINIAKKLDISDSLVFVPNSEIPSDLNNQNELKLLSQETIIVYFSTDPVKILSKFEAMVFIFTQNPFLAPLRFFQFLPKAQFFGNRLYTRFAMRRACKLEL